MENSLRYARCEKLFGDDFQKLQSAKIIILGVGGVGGFALDCLYRTGITNITIVDYDTFDETNQNRLQKITSHCFNNEPIRIISTGYTFSFAITQLGLNDTTDRNAPHSN